MNTVTRMWKVYGEKISCGASRTFNWTKNNDVRCVSLINSDLTPSLLSPEILKKSLK